jgi:hypothetical protein
MSQRLKPFSGLEAIWRGVYEADHGGHSYAVEVNYFDFDEKVHLYRDGTRIETKKSPARFETGDGAVIEAAMGLLGMKDVKLVSQTGETTLRPAAGSPEARRASFDRRHRTASRLIAVLAWLILVVAVVVDVPELISLVGDVVGFEFDSPFNLPRPVIAALGILALVAAIDRALRFKHNRWLG